jgi:hypothetical protein
VPAFLRLAILFPSLAGGNESIELSVPRQTQGSESVANQVGGCLPSWSARIPSSIASCTCFSLRSNCLCRPRSIARTTLKRPISLHNSAFVVCCIGPRPQSRRGGRPLHKGEPQSLSLRWGFPFYFYGVSEADLRALNQMMRHQGGCSHARFNQSVRRCGGACHERRHRVRRDGQDQHRRCASNGAHRTRRAYSQSSRRRAGECRPLLAWLVRCNLEQIWRLRAGERTSIPEPSGSWFTRNSHLSPLSLQSGPLPDGRRLLRPAPLCGHQPELLSLAPFSDGTGTKPLPLHAPHISWP